MTKTDLNTARYVLAGELDKVFAFGNLSEAGYCRKAGLKPGGRTRAGDLYYAEAHLKRCQARLKAGQIPALTPIEHYTGQRPLAIAVTANLIHKYGQTPMIVDALMVAKRDVLEQIKSAWCGDSSSLAGEVVERWTMAEGQSGHDTQDAIAVNLFGTTRFVLPGLFSEDSVIFPDRIEAFLTGPEGVYSRQMRSTSSPVIITPTQVKVSSKPVQPEPVRVDRGEEYPSGERRADGHPTELSTHQRGGLLSRLFNISKGNKQGNQQ